MHVREHLDDFIIRKVWRDNSGTLIGVDRWAPEPVIDSWAELYVDPDDGRVRETRKLCRKHGVDFIRERWAKKRAACRYNAGRDLPINHVGGCVWHARLSGIWYAVRLSRAPYSEHGYPLSDPALYDALEKKTWREQDRWYVAQKRQLCHKTLKALGLENLTAGAKEAAYD